METVLGYGDFRYAMDPEWGTLPAGLSYREVPDVVVGADERVYVFSRGDSKMIVLERDGHYVTSWGKDVFVRPHGVSLSHDGTLWCVDDGDHTVRRCTTDDLAALAAGARFVDHADGADIVRAGYPARELMIIERGAARVLKRGASGGEHTINRLGAGDSIGEMALFDRVPRSATVRAAGPVRTLEEYQQAMALRAASMTRLSWASPR